MYGYAPHGLFASRTLHGFRIGLLSLPFALSLGGATFDAQGTNLTVASDKLQVTFAGADVVGISNQLTGENYLRNPSPNMQLDLTLTQAPSHALAASGPWTVDSSGASASLTFTDSNRTISITVSVDPASQEVVVDLDGKAQQGGVQRLNWGVTGFDLTMGKFILPVAGGLSLTAKSFSAQNSYYFSLTTNMAWEAPLSLFQTAQGGVAIYSTDTLSLGKDLSLAASQQQTANGSFQVEAPGPWPNSTEAGPIEWRLAAYQGDWQAGARIYRDWHNAAAPPVPLSGARSWANNIRTVITVLDNPPYQNSLIDSLPSSLVPSETLLYLVNWRSLVCAPSYTLANPCDINYPDYTPHASTQAFIGYAHKHGFYVMLHTDMLGVSPSTWSSTGVATANADYAALQQLQIKDPLTLQLAGQNWSAPMSTQNRYAYIDPAASAYRKLFIARITPAIQTLSPDAIHLHRHFGFNDGNGLIEGMNFTQGTAQLHRDLMAAFPNLVLGTEQTSDALAPYASFSQSPQWYLPFSADATPPVPISAYVLPNVHRYWHPFLPDPYETGFPALLGQYEGQAVMPTYHTLVPDYSQPDMARYMKTVTAFQKYSLQPAWDTNWNGAVVSYQGTNGASAALTDTGTLVQFNLQQSGVSTPLYARAHATDRVDSPLHVANWPAYNGTLTMGLDPANKYWLDPVINDTSVVHVTSLPPGVKLGLGTGTLLTTQFSYFQLLPAAAPFNFDFIANLGLANKGITYDGADLPLVNNAAVHGDAAAVVGGSARQAIDIALPNTVQIGAETFFEYTAPIPVSSGVTLSFSTGILDTAIGHRQSPMTFKVEVNGAILWQQDVSTGGWQAGSIDLSPYVGQTITIRFVSNPGPIINTSYNFGAWSDLKLTVEANDVLNGVTLSVPTALTSSNIAVTGGSASVSRGTVTVNGLPSGGTVLVFTGSPFTRVAAGNSLINIPYTALSVSFAGGLAGTPPQDPILYTSTRASFLFSYSLVNAQTILSWHLQLPTSPNLALPFRVDANTIPDLSVRVNGTVLWHYKGTPSAEQGAIDLSPWNGQMVLLELIDSRSVNQPLIGDPAVWSDLTFGSDTTANCAASLSSSGPINAPAAGAIGTISVATASGCFWTTAAESGWITTTPSGAAGNGSVAYSIAANIGPARQSALVVAGHPLMVTQQAGAPVSSPPLPPVSSAPLIPYIDHPLALAMDTSGNLYVAESAVVRKISPSNLITLVAGTGAAGYGGDHGPATAAHLSGPAGMVSDGVGNLYIADSGNHVVRKVTPDGIITTIAGTGKAGSAGDGGPAQNAQLNDPVGIAVDGAGNIYVAEQGGARVRRIGLDGTIATIAGTGVQGFTGDNGPATLARLYTPRGLAFDANGNLLIADLGVIRMIRPDGTITTVAGNQTQAYGGDGGPAAAAAINWTFGVAVGPDGSVYCSDDRDSVVRKITPDGIISTFAGNGVNGYSGDGGLATRASLRSPNSVVVDAAGNVYIGDYSGNSIRLVTTDGMIATFAGKAPPQ